MLLDRPIVHCLDVSRIHLKIKSSTMNISCKPWAKVQSWSNSLPSLSQVCVRLHHVACVAPCCTILHHLAPSCTILHYLPLSSTILHYLAKKTISKCILWRLPLTNFWECLHWHFRCKRNGKWCGGLEGLKPSINLTLIISITSANSIRVRKRMTLKKFMTFKTIFNV